MSAWLLIVWLQTNNIYHSKLLKISLFSGPSFGHSGRSEFMLKKHSTLQKARLSIELTQYWEWAEYNTLNFAQFFPNDDQFILRFYFFTLTRPKMMNVLIWRHDDVIGALVINYSSKVCLFGQNIGSQSNAEILIYTRSACHVLQKSALWYMVLISLSTLIKSKTLTLSAASIRNESMTCSAVSTSVDSLVMKSKKQSNWTYPLLLGSTMERMRWKSIERRKNSLV